jgi:hypothetical protein
MNDSTTHPLEDSPEKIAHRLMQKANNQDGLPEIGAGLVLLTFAGLNSLQAAFPPGSPVNKDSGVALMALMVLLVIPYFASVWAIKKVRSRFLLGKIGYVKLKPLNRSGFSRVIVIAAIAFVVAAVLAAAVASRPNLSWLLAVIGISFGFLAILACPKPRYYIAGGSMAALGIVLAFRAVPSSAGMAILYGFIGLFCLVSGSITLATLLRTPADPGGMS